MGYVVFAAAWVVLVALGLLGWPRSSEVFFPATDTGTKMTVGTIVVMTAVALMLLVHHRRRWVVLGGIVFVIGMLPIVGIFVGLSRL